MHYQILILLNTLISQICNYISDIVQTQTGFQAPCESVEAH